MNAVGIPEAPVAASPATETTRVETPRVETSPVETSRVDTVQGQHSFDAAAIVPQTGEEKISAAGIGAAEAGALGIGLPLPTWDRDRLEFRLGAKVLRQFKIPSPHEEMILAVFAEMDWPTHIDDPRPSPDHPCELERTITALNRRQRPRLVDFCLDDAGQGITWEFSPKAWKSDHD